MSFLFGDQLLLALIAFGAAFWASGRLIAHSIPLVGLVVLSFVGAMFLSDLSVFISTNAVGAAAVLGVLVLLVQYLLKATLVESAAVTALAGVIGSALVYYTF